MNTIEKHLVYLEEYKVLICRACQHAINPSGVIRHFKDYHTKEVPPRLRVELSIWSENKNLVEPNEAVIPVASGAIPNIKVIDGFECIECGKLTGSIGSMKVHCQVEHCWTKAQSETWKDCKLQSFFNKPNIRYMLIELTNYRYFKVTVEEDMELPIDRLMESSLEEAYRRDEEFQHGLNHIMDTATMVDKSPWIRRTGWTESFIGRDMDKLVEAIDSPGMNDAIYAIPKGVERLLRRCGDGVRDCERRNWTNIGFWLNSIDATTPNTTPFHIHWEEATFQRYMGYWQRFICFCIRTIMDDQLGAQFTEEQRDLLMQIISTTELDDFHEDALDNLILQFSIRAIMHSDFLQTKSVLRYFCGVLGWNASTKTWKTANIYTPMLAGLQWCIRVIVLEYSIPTPERGNYPNGFVQDPVSTFRSIRDEWLVNGRSTPFNYVHKLLQYGQQVAKDTKGRDRIRFGSNPFDLYFDGRWFDVRRWKPFVQEILNAAEEILATHLLFLPEKSVPTIDLYQYVDDPNLIDAGYWFAKKDESAWKNGRKYVLDNLRRNNNEWDELVELQPDDIIWREGGVRNYERWVDKFLELVLLAINICCGLNGRGREMTSIQYMNTMNSPRHILIEDGQIMIVTEYHKSQAIMADVKVSMEMYDN
jgi:hypothetical protein